MTQQIKTKKGLVKAYNVAPQRVRRHFEHLPALLDQFPLSVVLAYAFAQLELAQNMALYCGVVKLYRANADLARSAVAAHHMTRDGFSALYKVVFQFDPPKSAVTEIANAEQTRDDVMHGKPVSDRRTRSAIASVLTYAVAMNEQLKGKHGIEPFGNLKGFSGRAKKLDAKTTRFMLKGMGLSLS